MRRLARLGITNPALNHVLTAVIIAVGAYAIATIPHEINPLVTFNWLMVLTPYPGASAQEVEREVTIPIEDNIANLEDLDYTTSESYEGLSLVWIRFTQGGAEFDRRVQEVRNAVNRTELPVGTEDTEIRELDSYSLRPVVEVAVFGEAPPRVLNEAADSLQRELLRIEDVHQAEIFGIREREIRVELDPMRMTYHRLSGSQIIDAIRARNLNLPAGTIKTGDEEFLVRTEAEYGSLAEVADTIVFSDPAGFQVTVGDVANLRDSLSDASILTRVDRQPCLILTITKTGEGNSLRIVRAISERLDHLRRVAPPGVNYRLINDSTVEISHSLGILESNALLGLAVVMVLLCLFLGWRSAIAAALGIPISFLLTLAYLRFTGETLNHNSLFALVLVLGMVVDDAIVVVENCVSKLQHSSSDRGRAIEAGVSEVASPVITSSLTTICAFMPLMLMPGIIGKFMRVIPLVVCVTLVASLFEAFVILPGHIREFGGLRSRGGGASSAGLISLATIQRAYAKLLVRCLRHRYVFLVAVGAMLILSLVLAGLLGFDLYGEDMLPSFKVLVKMPSGTSVEHTEKVLLELAQVVEALPPEELDHVTLRAGLTLGTELWTFLPTVGEVAVSLVPNHQRRRSVEQIADSVRGAVAGIAGPESVVFQFDTQGPPAGADLQILIKGKHLAVLEEIAGELEGRLSEIPGVQDIRDDLDRGTRELTVGVDSELSRRYGVTVAQVAGEVRTAFGGTRATVLHDGDGDVDVVVRYGAHRRSRMSDVLAVRFRAPSGEMVAFEDIASLSESVGFSDIRHHDAVRAVTVRASIDASRTTLSHVAERSRAVFVDLERRYPGYRLSIWGQWKEFVDAFQSLGLLFALGLLFIYLLLVLQFRSLVQPLVILMIVPLSFIGAAMGVLVLQRPVTIPTLYGFVALAGIAVNDSIVMIDFVNNLRRRLADRHRSLVMAGSQRLRPIILTSVTTIAGLLPLAIGIGGGTTAYQSLAVVVVAGLLAATAISLFAIPVLVHITDDLKARLGLRLEAEPAGVQLILKPTVPGGSGGTSDG